MLSRFQLGRPLSKRTADGYIANPKTLKEVKTFNGEGTFAVEAHILSLQYKLYEACPLKNKHGYFCKKKLTEQRLCTSCCETIKVPLDYVLLRLELQDGNDKECIQPATMFNNVGESFLGHKASEISSMEQKGDGEDLAKLLDSLIGKKIVAKIAVKEIKTHFNDDAPQQFDWIISSVGKSPPAEISGIDQEADKIEGPSTSKNTRK